MIPAAGRRTVEWLNRMTEPDPRYLEAVRLFNEREFFACHDAFEELWCETFGDSRVFYQGLIHAAVAVFHFEGGNLGGARRMYDSALRYLTSYQPVHLGLDVERFLVDLEPCFHELLTAHAAYPSHVELISGRIPTMHVQFEADQS